MPYKGVGSPGLMPAKGSGCGKGVSADAVLELAAISITIAQTADFLLKFICIGLLSAHGAQAKYSKRVAGADLFGEP